MRASPSPGRRARARLTSRFLEGLCRTSATDAADLANASTSCIGYSCPTADPARARPFTRDRGAAGPGATQARDDMDATVVTVDWDAMAATNLVKPAPGLPLRRDPRAVRGAPRKVAAAARSAGRPATSMVLLTIRHPSVGNRRSVRAPVWRRAQGTRVGDVHRPSTRDRARGRGIAVR